MRFKDKPKLLPIRKGLFEAKHYKRMGESIWLFGFLISTASWKTWEGHTTYATIRQRFSLKSDMAVYRWLQKLKRGGYITYKRGRYSITFRISKPRSQEMFAQIDDFVEKFGGQS